MFFGCQNLQTNIFHLVVWVGQFSKLRFQMCEEHMSWDREKGELVALNWRLPKSSLLHDCSWLKSSILTLIMQFTDPRRIMMQLSSMFAYSFTQFYNFSVENLQSNYKAKLSYTLFDLTWRVTCWKSRQPIKPCFPVLKCRVCKIYKI